MCVAPRARRRFVPSRVLGDPLAAGSPRPSEVVVVVARLPLFRSAIVRARRAVLLRLASSSRDPARLVDIVRCLVSHVSLRMRNAANVGLPTFSCGTLRCPMGDYDGDDACDV